MLGLAEQLSPPPPRPIDTETDWRVWATRYFYAYVRAGFAPRHEHLWEWAWALKKSEAAPPFVAIWPRGGGKSTTAEIITAMVGMRGLRNYSLYVCETQEQADKHVATISALFESAGIERALNKYGHSRGWRRNRLQTQDNYTVDALGLDTAVRGVKVEANRPDFFVLDDIDGMHDTEKAINKKEETLSSSILPAGSDAAAVLAIQNLVHARGIFSRLLNGQADYLRSRIISGPYPALTGFRYWAENENWVIEGQPTWEGQNLENCRNLVRLIGPRSFKRECQHDIGDKEGALWNRTMIDSHRVFSTPDFFQVVVGVDPSTTSTDTSDEAGIVGMGRAGEQGYVLEDKTLRGTPLQWAREAVAMYYRIKANVIIAEANNGGEMVKTVIENVDPKVQVHLVWASKRKETRAEPLSTLYEKGVIHHVGTLGELEDEMCSWLPLDGKSPNRIDALVWAAHGLGLAQPDTAEDWLRAWAKKEEKK